MTDDRAEFQTKPTMHGHQGLAGHLWGYLAIAQDEMREDREYRFARGALKTPDSDPTQTDAHVMGFPGEMGKFYTSEDMSDVDNPHALIYLHS
jgi:hypothetical protein